MKRALVVGLGISGMATAIALQDAGWEPLIIERSPERRVGGYFIGLFPVGKAAAEALGVADHMQLRTPKTSRSWELRDSGDRTRSTGFLDQPGKPDAVLRGDIEASLWKRVEGRIEVRFSATPVSIENHAGGASVLISTDGGQARSLEEFDLVVGADGLRSSVRKMVFGPHDKYMRSMDAMICAFQLEDQLPHFAHGDAVVLAEPKRSLWIFPFEDRAPTALFTYRTSEIDAQFASSPVEVLRKRYAGLSGDGAVERALYQLETASDYLFDSVHQVRMPSWREGRTILLGDSAWCLSLYSGMGASSGLAGAAALGENLRLYPDNLELALDSWQKSLRPTIEGWRKAAFVKAEVFVPRNALVSRLRRRVLASAGRKVATAAAAVPSPS